MLIKYRVLILAALSFTAVFVTGVALSIVSHKPKNDSIANGNTELQPEGDDPTVKDNKVSINEATPLRPGDSFCAHSAHTTVMVGMIPFNHLVRIKVIKAHKQSAVEGEMQSSGGQVEVEYAIQKLGNFGLGMIWPWVYHPPVVAGFDENGVVNVMAFNGTHMEKIFQGITEVVFDSVDGVTTHSFNVAFVADSSDKPDTMDAFSDICSAKGFLELYNNSVHYPVSGSTTANSAPAPSTHA